MVFKISNMRLFGFAFVAAAGAATCFLAAALSHADAASAQAIVPPDDVDAPHTVLFTGFGPFLNYTTNPTMEMALALQKDPCHTVQIVAKPDAAFEAAQVSASGRDSTLTVAQTETIHLCFEAHVLPVNRTGAVWTTQYLSSQLQGRHVPYSMVLHTGLENSAKGLKLEVAATNQQANDTGGPSTAPAVPGAPDLLPTTVNLGWMSLAALKAAGTTPNTTELWSRNAGDYYCNEVLYRTLNFVRGKGVIAGSTGAFLPAMFVHAPNASTSSLQQDLAVIKQVAAHALWSTYAAPGATPAPPAKKQDNEDVELNRGALALIILGCLVAGAGLVAVFMCTCKQCCEVQDTTAGASGPYVAVGNDEVPTPATGRAAV